MLVTRWLLIEMRMAFKKITITVLSIPRWAKRSIVLTVDILLCILTFWLAYYLRLGEFIEMSENTFLSALISVVIALPIFIISGLYRTIFRHTGWPVLQMIVKATFAYSMMFAFVVAFVGVRDIPHTIGFIQPILMLLFVGSTRLIANYWLGDEYRNIIKRTHRSKVLVYGAGHNGRQLCSALQTSYELQVVGFLDDDERLIGRSLNGLRIYNTFNLNNLVTSLDIKYVLIAISNLNRKRRNEILNQIELSRVSVRFLPNLTDLARGKIAFSNLREFDVEDLLGREPVIPNHDLIVKNLRGKVVMVTGAGGSIGSELCRQILSTKPSKLLLVEQSEYALYTIHQELQEKLHDHDVDLLPVLASVQDTQRIKDVLFSWHPDTIFHAAAYKHVPLVELNPFEGIKNNSIGTLRIALAAVENGVSNFVLISTDKAVRPANIMGVSKRLAEMSLQALANNNHKTKFSIVRFGNVLDSSGSVVPKFRQQIREGGPIKLTHLEIRRFFMTLSEASQLVIQAGAMAEGGEVFVLDMGEPVKIIDLARRMIQLSGLTVRDEKTPNGEIEIEVTGLRAGEKLVEELLIAGNSEPTLHKRILRAHEEFIPWRELQDKIRELETAIDLNDITMIETLLQQLVKGYSPSRFSI